MLLALTNMGKNRVFVRFSAVNSVTVCGREGIIVYKRTSHLSNIKTWRLKGLLSIQLN